MRQELARQIRESRTELMRAINCLTFWMSGFLPALLAAVLGTVWDPDRRAVSGFGRLAKSFPPDAE